MNRKRIALLVTVAVAPCLLLGCALNGNTDSTETTNQGMTEEVVSSEEQEVAEVVSSEEQEVAEVRKSSEPVYLVVTEKYNTITEWSRDIGFEYDENGRLMAENNYRENVRLEFDYETPSMFDCLCTFINSNSGTSYDFKGHTFSNEVNKGGYTTIVGDKTIGDDGVKYADTVYKPFVTRDENGNVTTYVYPADFGWNVSFYEYDDNDRLIRARDMTFVDYREAKTAEAACGMMSECTDEMVHRDIKYTYNENGDVVEKIDISGSVPDRCCGIYSFEYDEKHRLIKVSYDNSLEEEDIVAQNFTVDNAKYITTFTYDDEARKVRREMSDLNEGFKEVYDYVYDENNNLIKALYEDGSTYCEFEYDEHNNLIKARNVRLNENIVWTYTETPFDITYLDGYDYYTADDVKNKMYPCLTGDDSWDNWSSNKY